MNVIQVENLWKEYRLGVIGHGTLTQDLQSWWARVRGKEDPNSKIAPILAGQEKQIEGDHFWALRGINLEVKEGEILGIIGKNGAGKSTLLKILSRVTAPTRGNIKVKGRIASLLEVGTGFHPELTGRENIFMNGAILGMSKQEIKTKLEEIIDFSGVESFVDTPVKRYSSGMYVRLAFAVAAHLEPEILIIDEVLAVGDAAFQKKCLGKMQEISGAGRAVLFVSHNMAAISTLCSRTILLNNGEVVDNGPTSDVVLSYFDRTAEKTKNNNIATGDSYCRLIEAKIINQKNDNVNEVLLGNDFKILMSYQIVQESKDQYVPNLHLRTAEGQY
ncbi:MAG: ABC transporter ATP-binding protein, partial [Candidatus Electrothrix sp. AR1]|nr:ABC transporter ATP-binding protein [Candidatus Electrothrix sp. AR1]